MRYIAGFVSSFLLGAACMAYAQEAPPKPCESDPGFAQFDFWLGAWRVTDLSDGSHAGDNRISRIEGGCAVREQWRGSEGGTGTSVNYYNPVTHKWRQIWVASGPYSLEIEGGMRDGSMVMEGTISYYRRGAQLPFRGTWTPLPDGAVRQHFEEFDPASGKWTDWFDGRYEKASGAEATATEQRDP